MSLSAIMKKYKLRSRAINMRLSNITFMTQGPREGENERLCAIYPVYGWKEIRFQRVSSLEPLDQHASVLPLSFDNAPHLETDSSNNVR